MGKIGYNMVIKTLILLFLTSGNGYNEIEEYISKWV